MSAKDGTCPWILLMRSILYHTEDPSSLNWLATCHAAGIQDFFINPLAMYISLEMHYVYYQS